MNHQTKRFAKDSNLVTRRIAGETIIVPVRSRVAELDCVYTVNEVGSLIWDLVEHGTPLSEIATAICSAYEVTPEEAVRDLGEFLTDLEAAGLVRQTAGGES